jgi:hypothetical protein
MIIASVAITNVWRIHGYQEKQRSEAESKSRSETDGGSDDESFCILLESPSIVVY